MSEFITVAKTHELRPDDPPIVVEVNGRWVAIYNIGGEYFAIEDACTHDGNPLADGMVEDGIVTCPRHGAKFNIKTGKCLSIYPDVAVYHVRVVGDDIQVGDQKKS